MYYNLNQHKINNLEKKLKLKWSIKCVNNSYFKTDWITQWVIPIHMTCMHNAHAHNKLHLNKNFTKFYRIYFLKIISSVSHLWRFMCVSELTSSNYSIWFYCKLNYFQFAKYWFTYFSSCCCYTQWGNERLFRVMYECVCFVNLVLWTFDFIAIWILYDKHSNNTINAFDAKFGLLYCKFWALDPISYPYTSSSYLNLKVIALSHRFPIKI